jgi:hypothetical protein
MKLIRIPRGQTTLFGKDITDERTKATPTAAFKAGVGTALLQGATEGIDDGLAIRRP